MARPRALPRGPHRLAREEVLASQRGRLLDAIAEVVALRGYGAATVANVIDHAGVSRKTFYEHFRDKESCFLAVYDAGVEVLLATMREAGGESDHPAGRVRALVRAYLGTLALEPAFARSLLIEVAAVGDRALARRREVHDAFADFLAEVAPEDAVAETTRLAAVGATQEIVARWVEDGQAAPLEELEDAIVDVNLRLLAPDAA